jgi:DNA-binding transcriptional LysR family regulator
MNLNHASAFENPPLAAVRAFEAFARHGSVTRAATELGVTQSAVSHQLKALERFLGVTLAERRGRRLALTVDGRKFVETVRPAFAMLRAAANQMRLHAAEREAAISALPVFAVGWLIPRLGRFMAANPEVPVRVIYAQNRNYSSDAADISVRFGVGEWSNYVCERFLPGAVTPACSPQFLRRYGPFAQTADLLRAPLIHDEDQGHWARWFQSAGVAVMRESAGPLFEDEHLTRAAALAGLGAALVRPALIENDLERGNLVLLNGHYFDDGRDYYLCVRDGDDVSDGAKRLARRLRREVQSRSTNPAPTVSGRFERPPSPVGDAGAAQQPVDEGPFSAGGRVGEPPLGERQRRRPAVSEAIRAPANAAVTFLPWAAGDENSAKASSAIAAVAGAKAREGLV